MTDEERVFLDVITLIKGWVEDGLDPNMFIDASKRYMLAYEINMAVDGKGDFISKVKRAAHDTRKLVDEAMRKRKEKEKK